VTFCQKKQIILTLLSPKLTQIFVKNLLSTHTKTHCLSLQIMALSAGNYKKKNSVEKNGKFIMLKQMKNVVTSAL
jgi:hypothetical protein